MPGQATITSNLASISTAGVLTTLQTGVDTQTCIANTYPATGVNCTGGKSGGPVFAITPDGNGGALIQFADAGNNNQTMMQSTSSGSPYPLLSAVALGSSAKTTPPSSPTAPPSPHLTHYPAQQTGATTLLPQAHPLRQQFRVVRLL